jgi:hypothetical protein
MINIEGAWLSEHGQLVYIITQIHHRFVWHVVHNNGRVETGIGSFPGPEEEETANEVEALWNFDHGTKKEAIRYANGKVILDGSGKATNIRWSDMDHFKRLP